jgi:Phosphotransferase enzyme family
MRHRAILGVPSAQDENGFGWTAPDWVGEADAWVRRYCAVTGPIEQPHVRPWGTALRVPTVDGHVWFKACIAALAYEIPLLELLRERRPDCLPHVIASDHARGWMLLEDAGTRLRELEPSADRWEHFIATYAQFQIDVAPSSDALVRAGVPDSRTSGMFDDFTSLLEDERNLRASPDDYVSTEQVVALRALVPRLREHANRLDALSLPSSSAQHDDLHQWNVFVRDGTYVFLDWGDSCVSHPLLSLAVPLVHARESFGDAAIDRIRDAYLEPWTAFTTRSELLAACDSALLLAQITAILKWARIYSGLPVESRGAYDEVISRRAQDLLESACA